jgi:Flp pilus assembly protein TadG
MRFAGDEDGAVTVEAVLWIPFFFFVLMLMTDTSMAFFSKAQAYRIIENGNRAFAIKANTTDTATEDWVKTQFQNQFPRAKTDPALVVDTVPDKATGTVATTLTYRARDVVMFNTLGVLGNWTMTVQAKQYVEWTIK